MYIREAHPSDGWQVGANERDGVIFAQAQTEQERFGTASACQVGLKISIPILIDGMNNAVGEAYSAWPDRLYVVGKDGKIAYKGDSGPRGFRPEGKMENGDSHLFRGHATETAKRGHCIRVTKSGCETHVAK